MEKSKLDINSDPYFKKFIEKRKLSKSSQTVYNGRLRAFCEFLDKNPSDLIEEAQEGNGKKINHYFNDYIEELKRNGKSSSTIINRVDTVKAFFNEFNIDTEGLNNIIALDSHNLTPKKIISENQIKEALEISSLRDKAVILLHLSSGMEATELRHLTYGDFINSIEEYIDLDDSDKFNINKIADKLFKMDKLVGTWKIEKNRTSKHYVTFNSPESTRAILSYLMDRQRKNKPIKSLKDSLFVNSQNQVINVSAHGSIFKRINNRANFGYLTKKRRFFSSTMLRKYFKDKLSSSGLDEGVINALLGQKLDSKINYQSQEQIAIFKDKYVIALDSLSIEKEKIKTVESEEYKKLIEKLNEKDKELNEIRKQLKHIKQIIE
ncbi:MAG: tyrosine-type recombinase/integrase [Methanobacterium sp.]